MTKEIEDVITCNFLFLFVCIILTRVNTDTTREPNLVENQNTKWYITTMMKADSVNLQTGIAYYLL